MIITAKDNKIAIMIIILIVVFAAIIMSMYLLPTMIMTQHCKSNNINIINLESSYVNCISHKVICQELNNSTLEFSIVFSNNCSDKKAIYTLNAISNNNEKYNVLHVPKFPVDVFYCEPSILKANETREEWFRINNIKSISNILSIQPIVYDNETMFCTDLRK